jgi:hypothetical protein
MTDQQKKKSSGAKSAAAPAPPPCPPGLRQMCEAIYDWAVAWETWGNKVKAAVDQCCDTGDPEKLPPPPPPPFKP